MTRIGDPGHSKILSGGIRDARNCGLIDTIVTPALADRIARHRDDSRQWRTDQRPRRAAIEWVHRPGWAIQANGDAYIRRQAATPWTRARRQPAWPPKFAIPGRSRCAYNFPYLIKVGRDGADGGRE